VANEFAIAGQHRAPLLPSRDSSNFIAEQLLVAGSPDHGGFRRKKHFIRNVFWVSMLSGLVMRVGYRAGNSAKGVVR
jgi:hypothetical protein